MNNAQLREWYLKDLELPDTFHGRTTPKSRNIAAWKAIQPRPHDRARLEYGKIWVWSDTHFGHKNIIKYAEGARPFNSVQEMNDAMIANYREVVEPGDTVIFGGDIAFMGKEEMNGILADLPGYKIQIVGNHDMDRSGKLIDFYFHERHLCLVRDILGTKFKLLFTHYPLDTVPKGCVNVHGHIHQNVAHEHNINICVEHTGCAPMDIKKVEERAISYLEQHA